MTMPAFSAGRKNIAKSGLAACATALLLLIAVPAMAQASITALIQDRLDNLSTDLDYDRPDDVTVVHTYYLERGYAPIWVAEDGPTERGRLLARRLAEADAHGLVPEQYNASAIAALLLVTEPAEMAELDTLLSLGLLAYGQDLKEGRVLPSKIDPALFLEVERVDRDWLIRTAADSADLAAFLDTLPPQDGQYARTVAVLAEYRDLAARGGWATVPEGETLKVGMQDPRVPIIRQRLLDHGDLTEHNSTDPTLYDETLETAVKGFQYRHGLEQDGAIGPNTRAAFNVPVEDRIETLILNLERRRWLPDDLGGRYVFVNMAGFEMKVVDGDKTIWDTRIVVGLPYHATPVFTGSMRYIVVNPYWHITPSIARNEILPAVQKDVNYLASKNIRVFSDWSSNAVELDPYQIDWSQITPQSLRYKFRQDSGPGNALGRVKFMFPNRHNIYLHDTPSKGLFERAQRSFSHGCIRVQNPLDLAELLMAPEGWDRGRIDGQVESGERKIVNLSESIPVYLTYLTNWVNKDGSVYFREDIYGRDARLAAALGGQRV